MSTVESIGQTTSAASGATESGVKRALLAGLQTGDAALGGVLGAVRQDATTTSRLLASLTQVGQNVDLRA